MNPKDVNPQIWHAPTMTAAEIIERGKEKEKHWAGLEPFIYGRARLGAASELQKLESENARLKRDVKVLEDLCNKWNGELTELKKAPRYAHVQYVAVPTAGFSELVPAKCEHNFKTIEQPFRDAVALLVVENPLAVKRLQKLWPEMFKESNRG